MAPSLSTVKNDAVRYAPVVAVVIVGTTASTVLTKNKSLAWQVGGALVVGLATVLTAHYLVPSVVKVPGK